MAKKAKELGALAVQRLTKPGLYAVGGVAGLNLQVSDGGARSWLLRYTVASKRRALGLGGFPDVSLAGARGAAREARAKLQTGIDPIEQKKALRSALNTIKIKAVTFKECAESYIATHESKWRNAKHQAQYPSTLKAYVYPVIGNLLVGDIELAHISKILRPIWDARKFETAKRVRGRVEAILNWATVSGYRKGDNPARWHGFLSELFIKPHDARVSHHPALPRSEIAKFVSHLRNCEGLGARALEFAILTAARSGEARGAVWREIDLEAKIWTIPGVRMKAAKEHRVPLSPTAIKLLKALPHIVGTDHVFPAQRSGTLSDMTLAAVIKRMHETETKAGRKGYLDPTQNKIATPHGIARSTFRDWAAEETDYPREVAEMALSHAVGDKVEAAYRRGDLFDKRKLMMADWAAFCASPVSAVVVPMFASN